MTRSQAIDKALEYYSKRRQDAERQQDEREAKAASAIPELRSLLSERAALPLSTLKLAISQPGSASDVAELMRQKGLELNRRIRKALSEAGFPEDYISIKYECENCRDTGYVHGSIPPEMCACFEKRIFRLMNEDRKNGAFGACFEDFDENAIPDKVLSGERIPQNTTQRQLTLRARDVCRAYCDRYPENQSHGFIIHGNAGLGKTFLLSCMYNELISKGVNAIAVSSYELMERIRSKFFHLENADEAFDELIDADALFIDDLGVEPMMRNTEEFLCMLLNARMDSQKHTVITTNLMQAQLLDRYSERVMSRLADRRYWFHLQLLGDDLRRHGQ